MECNNVAVIILNWNGVRDTLECIESIRKNDYQNFTIIVADNGSSDNSIIAIEHQYPGIVIIDNKKNLGFAEGNNQAIRFALNNNFRNILLLNNDTIIDKNCLRELAVAQEKLPLNSILGCKICYYDQKKTIWHFGSKWNTKKLKLEKIAVNSSADLYNDVLEVDQIVGCAMWISADTMKQTGLLEKKYFLNYEETDWCFRAKKNGFQIYSIPSALVYHKISASFKGTTHSSYFLSRNRLFWIKRNFPLPLRIKFYLKKEIPAYLKMIIKFPLRVLFLPILYFTYQKSYQHNLDRIFECIAINIGITHYFMNRFGNCPSYIIKLAELRKKL